MGWGVGVGLARGQGNPKKPLSRRENRDFPLQNPVSYYYLHNAQRILEIIVFEVF